MIRRPLGCDDEDSFASLALHGSVGPAEPTDESLPAAILWVPSPDGRRGWAEWWVKRSRRRSTPRMGFGRA